MKTLNKCACDLCECKLTDDYTQDSYMCEECFRNHAITETGEVCLICNESKDNNGLIVCSKCNEKEGE